MTRWVRWGSVPVVALVVAGGIWVTGALLTDDFTLAQVYTGAFLAAAGALALAVAWRWRPLAVPVLVTFALVSGGLGGWLLLSSTRDVTVGDDAGAIRPADQSRRSGTFATAAHDTTGIATLLRRADGTLAVRLTDLATDPGPDLRVYLVPGDGRKVDGAVDLGRLKGNIGTQQYAVPATLGEDQAGAVVIWCRAFSVTFGYATLRAT